MSVEPVSDVHWLCPSCDAEPAHVTDARTCPTCGARLIEVRTKARDLSGTVIDGRFEIRDLLGEGGMGSVYRAWQRSIGREIAIKLIDERHGRDPMAVRRFLREARLASQLSQPNTISVIDFGQAADGRLFIAMELVRGRTLADVQEADGVFSIARAAWIGVQLCDALDAAHRLQIVHRDLKPSNIVVLDDPPGRDLIKVLDFGLAKSLTETETTATDTGLVVGTPRYMAPEVVMGAGPTPQSDLYAVGVILAELTTGKALWDATTFPQLAGQKLVESEVLRLVPSGLRGVVARLVAPEVGRRPASAGELRGLLRSLLAPGDALPATGAQRAIRDADAKDTAAASMSAPTIELSASGDPLPRADDLRVRSPSISLEGAGATLDLATPGPRPSTAAASGARNPFNDSRHHEALPPPRRWPLIAVAVVGAAVIGAIVVVSSRDGSEPAPPPASTATTSPQAAPPVAPAAEPTPPTPPPPAPPPASLVELAIRSRPPGAAITIDGQPVGAAPIAVERPTSDKPVVIEATLDGRTAKQRVVPDHSRTIELVLRAPRQPGNGMPF
ncbi:MAG: protein kinase [Deltaproteobacteria bacterium]|nr:protein kinase [Deltaproteobacteria bacterium]